MSKTKTKLNSSPSKLTVQQVTKLIGSLCGGFVLLSDVKTVMTAIKTIAKTPQKQWAGVEAMRLLFQGK